jgi:hypothetical protein
LPRLLHPSAEWGQTLNQVGKIESHPLNFLAEGTKNNPDFMPGQTQDLRFDGGFNFSQMVPLGDRDDSKLYPHKMMEKKITIPYLFFRPPDTFFLKNPP